MKNRKNTSPFEIFTFFGIKVYMGIVYYYQIEDYNNQVISNPISIKRYELILNMIHFSNNIYNPVNKLYKIQPSIDNMVRSFKRIRITEKKSADESIILF